jgi:hypothetical protein
MKTMTAQQVFDKAVGDLLKQNERSWGGNSCSYRGERGNKCAVGMVIDDDDDYMPGMEGCNVATLADGGSLPDYLKPHVPMLSSLQQVHDGSDVTNWYEEFHELVKMFGETWIVEWKFTPDQFTAR